MRDALRGRPAWRAAALSYAMGVLVQVFNHMVMPVGIPQQAVLVVCAIVQVALLHGARRAKLRDESDPNFEPSVAGLSVDALEYGAKWQDDPKAKAAFRRAVVRLTVATVYLSGVFAALNAGLTTLHAVGAVDLGDWPRLLLVVSSLAAGVLFDLHGRSYMNIGMTCAAMLSTLSFFVLIVDGNGGNELAATIIFYLGSGFFVVFFTTKYAAVSLYARWSYFWPCMGRVVNNVCSMFVTAPAVAIISSQNVLTAVGAALVMFVGIAITLLGQLGQRADDAVIRDELAPATDDLGGDLAPHAPTPSPWRQRSSRPMNASMPSSPPLGLQSASAIFLRPWSFRTRAFKTSPQRSSFRAPRSIVTFPRSTKRPAPPRVWPLSTSSGLDASRLANPQ